MPELSELERSKLDAPLARWYNDPHREPGDCVFVLVKCHDDKRSIVEKLIDESGGLLRGHGTLVRALRARIDRDTITKLVRHPNVIGLEMVHRSSSWKVSPYVGLSE